MSYWFLFVSSVLIDARGKIHETVAFENVQLLTYMDTRLRLQMKCTFSTYREYFSHIVNSTHQWQEPPKNCILQL